MGMRSQDQGSGLTRPPADLRECAWWRPCTISVLGRPAATDRVQRRMLPELLDAFRQQGHAVLDRPNGRVNLILTFYDLPETGASLSERIPEARLPIVLAVMRELGLGRRPDNLVVLLTIPERPSSMKHAEVVELSRTAMARIGAPRVVFLSGDRETGELFEATYCTLEGGHPSDVAGRADVIQRLRDRLISVACAREVGVRYRIVENAIPRKVWETTRTPEALIEAGQRMATLGLLPAPRTVGEYVSPGLARKYQHYLSLKGFSEGMLFAYDPDTQTLMVTASGSWGVDKRTLRREEIVAIGGMDDEKLLVYAPEGVSPKGPSVEAGEMYALMRSVARTRIGRNSRGEWVPDPKGEAMVSMIRAGVHAHVGVRRIEEQWVEDVPPNRREFPYGFGCGSDLMAWLAQDAARRSRAINDPSDPRGYVRWPMLYHGETAVELWKPRVPARPLVGLLDMYDPQRVGAIEFTPDHIDQPE